MTTPHPLKELLSAYFDGEVSPQERARVEALRRQSPEVEAELQALAELSQLVKGLPREPAPPEILSAVMQAAERRALLPAALPRRRRVPLLREMVIFLTGAAAAGLVFLAGPFETVAPRHSARPAPASSPAPRAVAVQQEIVQPPGPGEALPGGAGGSLASLEHQELRDSLRTRQTTSMADAQPAGPAGALRAASSSGESAASVVGTELPSMSRTPTAPAESHASADPSDVMATASVPLRDALACFAATPARSQELIVNVDLYTTDAQRTAGQLLQNLVNHGVQPLSVAQRRSGDKTLEAERQKTSANSAEEQPSENPAVYVQAPAEAVTLSLEQLVERRELLGVRLRPPLELPSDVTFRREVPAGDGSSSEALDIEQLIVLYRHAEQYDLLDDALPAFHENTQPADALRVSNAPTGVAEAVPQRASSTSPAANQKLAANSPTPRRASEPSPLQKGQTSRQHTSEELGGYLVLTLPKLSNADRFSPAFPNQKQGLAEQLSSDFSPRTNDRARAESMRRATLPGSLRFLFVIRETNSPSTSPAPAAPTSRPVGPAAPR